jgi:hypothetical protein
MKCGVCKSEIPLKNRKQHLVKYHNLDIHLAEWIVHTDDQMMVETNLDHHVNSSDLITTTTTISEHVVLQFDESIDETLKELPPIISLFQANTQLLNKMVTNQGDFILGVVLSQIISNFLLYCRNRCIKLSTSDMIQVYSNLINRVPQFREFIKKSLPSIQLTH